MLIKLNLHTVQNILLFIRDDPQGAWCNWVDRVDPIPLADDLIAVGPTQLTYRVDLVVALPQPAGECEAVVADVYVTRAASHHDVDRSIVTARGEPAFRPRSHA